ncbi:NAD(P)/FAD-dependent oxidoreductase [Sulfitobacter geojensis]|uniref:NAD(P)/FAD-dependent oxidoreductase n=1 Tax=Sulfitobacter geojensis TaxID=1342299 RepID=UPI00249365EF|nr:tryptophan 7-halogenase [Sulfitobacter geojensis]
MRKSSVQVAVAGAGPAGAIAARQLGLAGLDVVLIDPFVTPAGHLIESFPASGAPLAEEIGLLAAICDVSDGPAEAMRMAWRDVPETRAFEGGGPLLLDRIALHEKLRAEALRHVAPLQARLRGVVTSGRKVELSTSAGTIRCDMLIDARGRQAQKRAASDVTALPFSAVNDLPPHQMWLEALPDGWVWACSLGGGVVQGAVFQRAAVLAGMRGPARAAYVADCLAGTDTFVGARGIDAGQPAAAGLSATADPLVSERHILVGDAALARDPIASHGLVHAMRSGVQGALAVLTALDRDCDSHAAFSFMRDKHREAVAAARLATQRAYADQSRFETPFWATCVPPRVIPDQPDIGQGAVTLAAPLTRAPVLENDRIRWRPAIELASTDSFLTGSGSITALDIAAACRPAASLPEIANRLGRQHDMPAVFEVLERLTLGGAFVQAAVAP